MNPITDALLAHVHARPNRIAVADHQRRMTFAELLDHVAPLADRLGERPVGDVVVAAVRDVVDTAVAALAALAVARPISVVSARRDPAGLGLHARSVRATTLVTPAPLGSLAPDLEHVGYPSDQGATDRRSLAVRPLPMDAVAILATTSGSTGDPKLVPRPVRTMLEEQVEPGDALAHRPDDVLFRAFFAGGGTARAVLRSISAGTTMFCIDPLAVPASRIVPLLGREGVTFARVVPSVLRRILGQQPVPGGLPTLRVLASGGEPLRWDDVELARRHMHPGSAVVHTYGSTEVSGIAARVIPFGEPLGIGRVPAGRPRPGRRIVITDDAGVPVAPGVEGRVVIEGWLGGSSRLFEELPDGSQRFRSSDRGFLDLDGTLHLTGRSDDVVKIGAVRVDTAAVEEVVRSAPGVKEAAVTLVGVDERKALVAHVVLADPSGNSEACASDPLQIQGLREHLARVLESAAVPARIVVHDDALPLLPSGKVDRRALAGPDA